MTLDTPRRVIVVTDGDHLARRALKMAAKQLRVHVISRSAGNPSKLTAPELVRYVMDAERDPVIVMFDDNGDGGQSSGEQALVDFVAHPSVRVIGALAVASNTSLVQGVKVDFSIDCMGRRVTSGVNKDGIAIAPNKIYGDTVDVLRKLRVPVVVGVGDIGKMGGRDAPERASPVTTAALQAILDAQSSSRPFAQSRIPEHA
jgi:stage V sporulation protein AE